MMGRNNEPNEMNTNTNVNGNENPLPFVQENKVSPTADHTDNDKKPCIEEEEETKSGKEQTMINPSTIAAVAVSTDTKPAEADEKAAVVQPNSGCCGLFRHELSLACFETYNKHELNKEGNMSERTDLEEQEDDDDNQNNEEDKENQQKKTLLLQQKYGEMFNTGTANFKGVFIPKLIFLLLTVMTIIWSWIIARTPSFFLAYWSHWIVIYALVYQCLSLGLSLSRQDHRSSRSPPEWIFKFTWFMFSNAGTHKIIMMIMVWLIGFTDSTSIFSFLFFMVHGGVAVLLMIQGFLIDRIPVRLRHYPVIAIFGLLYILWTLIHAFTLYENPDADFDGGVYPNTIWTNGFVEPTLTAVGVTFVIVPFSFLILWIVSVAIVRPGRRERLFAFFANIIGYGSDEEANDDAHAYDGTKKTKVVESRQETSMMDTTVAASDLELGFKNQQRGSTIDGGFADVSSRLSCGDDNSAGRDGVRQVVTEYEKDVTSC